jgi:hypothetical protein
VSTHFVPTEEIQKLTLGSYEYLASKIDEAISKNAKQVFGDAIPNKVERIGTFGDHVLVAADDGRFVKVKYERLVGGAVKIMECTAVTVPIFTESNLGTYLMQEARGIVDSILAHDSSQVELKLRALAPLVSETQAPTAEQVVASVMESVRADRPWKRLYRERTAQVSSFLGESLKGIESRRLSTKFAALLAEGASEAQNSLHRPLVLADLSYMAEAIGGWLRLVEDAGNLSELQSKVEGEESAVVTTFAAFAEDLKLDLQSTREAIQGVVQAPGSVISLGALYDALAEESFHYEVASIFASMMIEGLSKPE